MKAAEPCDPSDSADIWDGVIANLASRHVDPTRFPDMTYPLILAILTDGNPDKAEREHDRARKVMADFKRGKFKTS